MACATTVTNSRLSVFPPAAYLVFRKETSASRPFPESEGAGAHKCWLMREGRGCRDQGGAIRRQLCLLGAGPGSPSGATPSNVFELFCRTKPPTDESQRGGPPAPVLGPLNTSSGEECKLASTLVLLWGCIFYSPNCKPPPSSSLPKGDPVFRAAACCDPLCLAKQFKVFLPPSPKNPSPR